MVRPPLKPITIFIGVFDTAAALGVSSSGNDALRATITNVSSRLVRRHLITSGY
jgi:hypothetical protein